MRPCEAYIAVQTVASCIGLHPFQDRKTAFYKKLQQTYPQAYYDKYKDTLVPRIDAACELACSKCPDIQAGLAALPHGCTPEQSQEVVASTMQKIMRMKLTDAELAAVCKHIRDAAFKKCSMKPSSEQLKAAMAWAYQTHGIAFSQPSKQSFLKKQVHKSIDATTWYICGSPDLVAGKNEMVVVVKLRLQKLQYSLTPCEEAHLQALMHLTDAPIAAILEIHATEGMTLQRLDRKAEDWDMLQAGLVQFIKEVTHEGCATVDASASGKQQ